MSINTYEHIHTYSYEYMSINVYEFMSICVYTHMRIKQPVFSDPDFCLKREKLIPEKSEK